MKRLLARAGAVLATCSALIVAPLTVLPATAATNVADEDSLRAAISASQDVTLSGNITLTSPIEFPENYAATIDGGGFTITGDLDTAHGSSQGMFIVKGTASVTHVTVDGARKWRPFWVSEGATLNLNAATTVTKGSSNADVRDGGAVFVDSGATLNMDGSTISESTGFDLATGMEENLQADVGSGGAVATRANATVTGRNCTLTNNHTSRSGLSNGGAIFLSADSRLTLDACVFSGNSTRLTTSQGNQGGAIRTVGGTLNVSDSVFNVKGEPNHNLGISGGAIGVEDTQTTITGSTFSAEAGATLFHAGGFISVAQHSPLPEGVERSLVIHRSTFTGSGGRQDDPVLAAYGGAIAFESGDDLPNYSKALIVDSAFSNLATTNAGDAIALNTHEEQANSGGVDLIVRDSTISQTRAFSGSKGNGGGVFVGQGNNTVLIDGGTLNQTFAAFGGAIFNAGTTTVTGGAAVTNGNAYAAGGGAFNAGVLTLDDTSWSGHTVKRNAQCDDCLEGYTQEFAGVNIYAKKDVTITPTATLDGKDIRVLDDDSAVLLTGPLSRQVNISLPQEPNWSPVWETKHRYLEYTVAKGTRGYTVTPEDAKFLHYVSLNTATQSHAVAHQDGNAETRVQLYYIYSSRAQAYTVEPSK